MRVPIETMATYEEIAQDMGLTRSAVRKIEQRALRKLKSALADRGMSFDDLLPTEQQFTQDDVIGAHSGT